MAMTKKHYEIVTKVLARNHRFNLIEDEQFNSDIASITRIIITELARDFEDNDSKFNRAKFEKECGL